MFWKEHLPSTKDHSGNRFEFDYDVYLQCLKCSDEKWPQFDQNMTSPWPLFDEMLVSLPLDNLLCCSSSLPFGVTQLSIYRLDIIPIYFALWLFLRFFNWEKSFWKFRFLKYSRNLIFENFDFLLKFFFVLVFYWFWMQSRRIIMHDISEIFANHIESWFWTFQLTTTTTTVKNYQSERMSHTVYEAYFWENMDL